MFNRITIIGLGLIGSSIARAAHERKLAAEIVGCDSNEASLAYGRSHGFIDTTMRDAATAARDSDLVIIATPPSTLEAVARAIGPSLKAGCIVMDTCSVKLYATLAIAPYIPPGATYIPAHPIAGSEDSGISAGRADLFMRRRVIVTPEHPDLGPVLQTVTRFWEALGARVEGMPPEIHDMIYAYVSHLPQLLSFATPAACAVPEENDPALQKFLRLSGSSLHLWADIFALNKNNIISALDRYLDAVSHIISELKTAPEGSAAEADDRLARTVLFPRIAASCLITTVMEAEKNAGFPFARFAGTGFADFTYPASQPPEEDLERISGQYHVVAVILGDYAQRLADLRVALDSGDKAVLEKALG